MVGGSPFLCIRHTAQSLCATASSAPGAVSASTSLIIEAPAARAAFITAGRRVSTETQRSESCSSTGITRLSSSSSGTGAAPGGVIPPPISMISTPSLASLRAWAMASFRLKNMPPSEKESGVTLITPMTSGRSSESSKRPQRNFLGGRRRCGGALGTGVARRWLGGRLRAGGLRRPRRLAGHDVADLVGVERLVLEQRLGHHLDLFAVLLEDLASDAVLLIDDAADLGVDLLHGRFGHALVRGHRAAEEHFALVLAVHHGTELVGHAPLRHHAARDFRGALEVVRRAGGHLVHEQLFGDAAAEQHRDHAEQPVAVLAVAVLGRQLHGHAERTSARNHRDLV